jgi:hypothetical protein
MHAEIVAKLIQRKKSRPICALNALARATRAIAFQRIGTQVLAPSTWLRRRRIEGAWLALPLWPFTALGKE